MSFIEVELRNESERYNMSDFQSHDFFELYLLLSGTREVFIENKLFSLCAPAFCVIAPYAIHKTEGAAYTRINLYLSRAYLNETELSLLRTLSEQGAFSLSSEQMQFLQVLLTEACRVEIGDAKSRTHYLSSFARTALSYLSVQTLVPLLPAGVTPSHTTYRSTTILQIVRYLNEHYAQSITLEDLSRRFFLSKNTLCKRFRQAMGCSPIQYLLYVRQNKAKMYLSSTEKDMASIAQLCGFSSANYFSLSFKKQFGMSPLDYRKKR